MESLFKIKTFKILKKVMVFFFNIENFKGTLMQIWKSPYMFMFI